MSFAYYMRGQQLMDGDGRCYGTIPNPVLAERTLAFLNNGGYTGRSTNELKPNRDAAYDRRYCHGTR